MFTCDGPSKWLAAVGLRIVVCTRYSVYTMKKAIATTQVSIRQFRAAPAKVLGRAARTGTRLRIGDFIVAVQEADERPDQIALHGCMRSTGRIVGDPRDLLCANDRWATDA